MNDTISITRACIILGISVYNFDKYVRPELTPSNGNGKRFYLREVEAIKERLPELFFKKKRVGV